MLTTISKTFDFDAAHRLDRLPEDHKCHRLHGHTYRVEIRLRGEPGGRLGMLIDYAEIAAAWAPIDAALAPCSKLRREIREELDLIRSGKTIYNERCSTCEGELKIAVQVCDSLTCRTLASLRADAEANHG